MKKCIWCLQNENDIIDNSIITFKSKAHTIPQSIGGQNICENVCDSCNKYFGRHHNGYPPIETAIKEAFDVSRARFLSQQGGIGKNKPMSKFSSNYFKVDFKKPKIELKSQYKFHKGFQEKMGRQLKRGLYKIYLEELERQKGIAINNKYDFIRTFARYDLNELPVFYFERKFGIYPLTEKMCSSPELYMEENAQFKYLISHPAFFEFEILGHTLSIAISSQWHLVFNDYIKLSLKAKKELFISYKTIQKFNDFDLLLSKIDENM